MENPINDAIKEINHIKKLIAGLDLESMCSQIGIQQEIADLNHTVTQLLLNSSDPEATAIKFAEGSAVNYDGHEFTEAVRKNRKIVGLSTSELTAADVNRIIYAHWDTIVASSKLRYRPFIHFYPGMLEMGMTAPICGRSVMVNPITMHPITDKYSDDLGLRALGLDIDIDTDEKMVVFAVTHEFCHIQQTRSGRLNQHGVDLIWEGSVFNSRVNNRVSKARISKQEFEEYVSLPWEVEANRGGVRAIQEIWG